MKFQDAKKANGSIEAGKVTVLFHGTRTVFALQNAEIALTHPARMYNYGTDGAVRYSANGMDEAGNCYLVVWDTTAAWDAAMEESDENVLCDETLACDWESPAAITLLEEVE